MQALPIDSFIDKISDELEHNSRLILSAEPGAGKTTRLPPLLLQKKNWNILVSVPRRIAAVSAAHRVASDFNLKVGSQVGYQVRSESRFNTETKLIFLTERLLLKRLIEDPEANSYNLIILDEFHERSSDTDLILAHVHNLQNAGYPIKLLVMSATLDAQELSSYLNSTNLSQTNRLDIPGKLFPLEILYDKKPLRLNMDDIFFQSIIEKIRDACQRTKNSILVFLPGVGEIERCKKLLSTQSWAQAWPVFTLHGSMRLEEQNEVIQSSSRARIILSTNVAESSLTVPGVQVVIDTGLARVQNQNPLTGFSELEIKRISLSNARQRAGRAARQWPGICFRLWNKQDELSMRENEIPEFQRSDLSSVYLHALGLGYNLEQLPPFLLKPKNIQDQSAKKTLLHLGACDLNFNITEKGRQLLNYSLAPHLAALVISSKKMNIADLGLLIACILEEKDFLKFDREFQHQDTQECDICWRIDLILDFIQARLRLQNHVNLLHANLQKILQNFSKIAGHELTKNLTWQKHQVQEILFDGFSAQLARKRQDTNKALWAEGKGLIIKTSSLVQKSPYLLFLSGRDLGSEIEVSMATGLSKDFLWSKIKDQIEWREEITFDEEKQKFYRARTPYYFDLALESSHLEPAEPSEVEKALPQLAWKKWSWICRQNNDLQLWWQRWTYFCLQLETHKGSIQSQAGIENILSEFEQKKLNSVFIAALEKICYQENSLEAVIKKNIVAFIEMELTSQTLNILKDCCPNTFKLPNGKIKTIQYTESVPFVEAKIQDLFGVKKNPLIFYNLIPLKFKILGPNYRPVQVTQDLAGFWQNSYKEIRKELRARYPKHNWPENP